jgi:arylsulfatase A-like enzyme
MGLTRRALATLLAAPAVAAWGGLFGDRTPRRATAQRRPNIIAIVTDDLDRQSLASMPNIQALLSQQGTTFTNFLVADPSCGPARASILRGQYTQNHQMVSNSPPNGGWGVFAAKGEEASTVATWLHDAGYRTGLFGKYLNEYDNEAPTHVPPGWDRWFAWAGNGKYFRYRLNDNGTIVKYGTQPQDYETDVLAADAQEFIASAAADGAPFFAYIAPHAPHEPNEPAPRHASAFPDATAPRYPSFNEADLTDKPGWITVLPELSADQVSEMDELFRRRLRTLLAVDDMVAALIATLETSGVLASTYLFFTSDNGWHFGEHRLVEGKGTPYEEASCVPLIVRGPGVPAARIESRIASQIDLAPTFATLADAELPDFVDGRSLLPLLIGDEAAPWRQAVLVQHISKVIGFRDRDLATPVAVAPGTVPQVAQPAPKASGVDRNGVEGENAGFPSFRELRGTALAYIEYENRPERELYDLLVDPFELDNVVTLAPPELVSQLSNQLAALATCAGASCRSAEDAPVASLEVTRNSVFTATTARRTSVDEPA